jgi:GH24 family phage-related lysozyme (muramidase)
VDEHALNKILQQLRQFEGFTTWMYQDSATPPNVTIGIGFLLSSSKVAVALPFLNKNHGQYATSQEIVNNFNIVHAMPGGLLATKYNIAPIYLPEEDVYTLGRTKLENVFLPGLVKLCPDFETFPIQAQSVLIDLAWNLGVGKLGTFTQLIAACNANNWNEAAIQSHVKTSRQERNNWRYAHFLAIES